MKYNVELIKNIEFVFEEKYGKKIIIIPYDLIRDIYLETIFPEFCDYLDNPNAEYYYMYDHSNTKEYIVKYTGIIVISKKWFDYELDIETIKYLTDMKKLSKLSHIIINYNDNTRTIYKNTIIVYDDEDKYELSSTFDKDNYEYPSVVDSEQVIHLTFVYDCGTYKRVGTPNK